MENTKKNRGHALPKRSWSVPLSSRIVFSLTRPMQPKQIAAAKAKLDRWNNRRDEYDAFISGLEDPGYGPELYLLNYTVLRRRHLARALRQKKKKDTEPPDPRAKTDQGPLFG